MDEEERRLLDNMLTALKDIRTNQEKQNKIALLDIFLDQNRYLARKVRAGEAYVQPAFFFLTVAGLATVTFTTTCPDGYIAMSHVFISNMSQSGVFSITYSQDGRITPFFTIVRAVPETLELSQLVPYANIVLEWDFTTIVNNDPVQQWLALTSIDTFIRKEVWERDKEELEQASKEFRLLREEQNG